MDGNEIRIIISDLERISNHIEHMDQRIDNFIKKIEEIQKVQEQVNHIASEQTTLKDSLAKAWKRIEEIDKQIVNPQKMDGIFKQLDALQQAPAKKVHEAYTKLKSTIISSLFGAIAAGVIAFIFWIINMFLNR